MILKLSAYMNPSIAEFGHNFVADVLAPNSAKLSAGSVLPEK